VVSQSLSISSYSLYLALVDLPDHPTSSNSSQNDVVIQARGSLPLCDSPATSLIFVWKKSMAPIKRTRSSCCPEARRGLAIVQKPP
jgi:hypothetical protein